MNKSYFLGLVLLLLFNTRKGYTQSLFLYEHPNKAPDAISPLFSLLSSLNNTILGSYGISGTDQSWDTVQQHYRGNILSYLYYPEMASAGYSSFSVAKTGVYNPWSSISNNTEFLAKLDEIQKNINEDKRRRKIRYYYDRSGWLSSVEEVNINPEYQGFYEKCDSLNYIFHEDGSVQINWLIKEHSSGSGYAGTIYCDALTSVVHQIYKRSTITVKLNKWHNVTSIESMATEKWDTCSVGPEYGKKEIYYDSIGRMTKIVDSNSAYESKYLEVSLDYYAIPFERYLDSVKGTSESNSLKVPVIANWLQSQKPLTYIAVSKTSKYYLRYNNETRKQILYPDSPSVKNYFAPYLINKNKQRVATWNNSEESWLKKDAFALYSYSTNTKEHFSVKEIQFLPFKIPNKDTFELAGASYEFIDTIQIGKYRAISFKTGEKSPYRPPRNETFSGGDHSTTIIDHGSPKLYFSTTHPLIPFDKIKGMVLIEKNLIQYLLTNNDAYYLTYYK